MLGVITCVCALHLAAALDIPLEGKSAPPDLQNRKKQTVNNGFNLCLETLGGKRELFLHFCA